MTQKSLVIASGAPRVSRVRGQSQFGRPIQFVRGSIDAKSELGVKGRQKLTRAPHIVVSGFWARLKTSYDYDVRIFESWKSLNIVELRI